MRKQEVLREYLRFHEKKKIENAKIAGKNHLKYRLEKRGEETLTAANPLTVRFLKLFSV